MADLEQQRARMAYARAARHAQDLARVRAEAEHRGENITEDEAERRVAELRRDRMRECAERSAAVRRQKAMNRRSVDELAAVLARVLPPATLQALIDRANEEAA